MQFICNVTDNIEADTNATHICFYEPIGVRISNIHTPWLPGKYGPINVRLFNLTYYEVIINFKPVPRINYTLLYEENYWVNIGPSYLLDEYNQFFKAWYPPDLNSTYPNPYSLLITFQTNKATFRGSYLDIDIPNEININSPFKPKSVDLVDPGSLNDFQAYFEELPCMVV
jgi:hypothetical protein